MFKKIGNLTIFWKTRRPVVVLILAAVVLCVLLTAVSASEQALEEASNEVETADQTEEVSAKDIISVSLPSELPFSLILPREGGVGIVDSNDFWITNNNTSEVIVTLENAKVSISDPVNYMLAGSLPLPDYGSALYMTLICTQNGVSEEYPIFETPRTAHTFHLEGGESVSFRISGAVSERGDASWAATEAAVSLSFMISEVNQHYETIEKTDNANETEDTDETEDAGETEDTDESDDAGETENTDESEDADETEETDESEDAGETEETDESEDADETEETDESEDADKTEETNI